MSVRAIEMYERNPSDPQERMVNLLVNNGFDRVAVDVNRGTGGERTALALSPAEATQLALELLNAANNVDRGIHGDNPHATKVAVLLAGRRLTEHKGGA